MEENTALEPLMDPKDKLLQELDQRKQRIVTLRSEAFAQRKGLDELEKVIERETMEYVALSLALQALTAPA